MRNTTDHLNLASKYFNRIGLHHPLDGVTNPKYKLLHFIHLTIFCKKKRALAFNQDRCCDLALCLQLILFHWAIVSQWLMAIEFFLKTWHMKFTTFTFKSGPIFVINAIPVNVISQVFKTEWRCRAAEGTMPLR